MAGEQFANRPAQAFIEYHKTLFPVEDPVTGDGRTMPPDKTLVDTITPLTLKGQQMCCEQFEGDPAQQNADYHAAGFQTIDPVTGGARELPHDPSTDPPPEGPDMSDIVGGTRASGGHVHTGAQSQTEDDADAESYDEWSKNELQAECEERGLDVRGSGSGGRAVHADYVKALKKSDKKAK
jgi:hypothetical protein